jgi:hypothetical protein
MPKTYEFIISIEGSGTAYIDADSVADAQAKFDDGDWEFASDDATYEVETIDGEIPPPDDDVDGCKDE